MNDKLETAKKLALITGKPLSDFYEGEVEDETNDIVIPAASTIAEKVARLTSQTRDPIETPDAEPAPKEEELYSEEVIAFKEMFADSIISKGKIMKGREMTRKEYLKHTRNKTEIDILNHPLLYKMFRAEGQVEAFFTRWCEKFPKA